MESGSSFRRTVRFVSNEAPKLDQYAITDENGEVIHVYDAAFIRLLSAGLGVRHRILTPADGSFGEKQPDGNWTGMIGMVKRSDVDLAMDTVTLTEERYRDVGFIYPHVYSDLTFIADKPTLSRNQSVFSPFANEVWLMLAGSIVAVSVLLFASTRRKVPYPSVLFRTFGSFLEKEVQLKGATSATGPLLLAWVLGAMVLSQSYKAVLLAFLSIPDLDGIRTVAELSRAASEGSVRCYTYFGSYLIPTLTASEADGGWRTIGECLGRSQNFTGDALEAFFADESRKSFLTGRIFLYQYDRDFFISRDSFFPTMYAIPMSEGFCCEGRLNALIHRLVSAGIFEKQLRDEYFSLQITRTVKAGDDAPPGSEMLHGMSLEQFSGAFEILAAGWLLSTAVLLVEKMSKRFL